MSWPVTATYTDGTTETFSTMDDVPVESVIELRGPAENGEAIAYADVANGETVRRYQTQVIRVNAETGERGESLSIPTFVVYRHGIPVAYAYFPPDGVPRLSTRELRWL